MIRVIGVPKEIKNSEHRISLTPDKVSELKSLGCEILIQKGAGLGLFIDDAEYEKKGARIVDTAKEIFDNAELILKVKEPQNIELEMLQKDQILFTYLHLSPDLNQTKGLLKSGCSAIAYETIVGEAGNLPLLAPMSDIAGKLSIQFGAKALEKHYGGKGILLSGSYGIDKGKVIIIGAGIAGMSAAQLSLGLGADTYILESNINKLAQIEKMYHGQLHTIFSNEESIKKYIIDADLVIGSVLIPGENAPKLIKKEYLKEMKKKSVIIDIAIDQGGCAETSRPTTHEKPIYIEDDILHYCVANMPGAVPLTSTIALSNSTFKYVKKLVKLGLKEALLSDPGFLKGLNIYKGQLTNEAVARSQKATYKDPINLL